MANVSGSWTGTYWQLGHPTRFEATLSQGGNTLTGQTLDDARLGEARISGQVYGRTIHFAKQYLMGSQASIDYEGSIAEDESYMSGQWVIPGFDSGHWEAHRREDTLLKELKQTTTQQMSGLTSGVAS